MARTWMKTLDAPAASDPAVDPQAEALRLFADHGTALYRFCRSMLGGGDDAEDVVQDAFVKLLQHLRAGGDRTNLRAWLFTVAANGCRDRARRRFRWLPWTPELDVRPAPEPEDPPDLAAARRALATLAARDRLLLSLRAQGLTYAEIAGAAGIKPASVGRLLARAVERWKKNLGGPARAAM
jgi:RNA polymerase sigma-70 factor (ECF subfamily)